MITKNCSEITLVSDVDNAEKHEDYIKNQQNIKPV